MFIHPGTLKPYSPAMVRRLHQKVLERAQLPNIHFRDLRHTCAIRNLEAGRRLKDVSAELGRNPDFVTKHRYKNYLPHDAIAEAKIQQTASTQEQQLAADTFQSLLTL
jgi:integrase